MDKNFVLIVGLLDALMLFHRHKKQLIEILHSNTPQNKFCGDPISVRKTGLIIFHVNDTQTRTNPRRDTKKRGRGRSNFETTRNFETSRVRERRNSNEPTPRH